MSKHININILSSWGDVRVASYPMGREIGGPPFFVGPTKGYQRVMVSSSNRSERMLRIFSSVYRNKRMNATL